MPIAGLGAWQDNARIICFTAYPSRIWICISDPVRFGFWGGDSNQLGKLGMIEDFYQVQTPTNV